jgi:hypothetical protein
VPAAHRRCTTPLPASWTIPVGRGFKSDGGPPAGGARDRELAHRRESRLSHEVPLGWAVNRCRHRSRPSPKCAHERGRTPTALHAPGRARPWCTGAAQPPGPAVAWGRAYRCGTLSSPHAGEPRSLHVSSGAPVGADRGPLRATIRDSILHRISLTIVNGQPGATGSGPRGTGMVRSNPSRRESLARAGSLRRLTGRAR